MSRLMSLRSTASLAEFALGSVPFHPCTCGSGVRFASSNVRPVPSNRSRRTIPQSTGANVEKQMDTRRTKQMETIEHVTHAAPSITSEKPRDRARALQSMLDEARRTGTAVHLPSMLDYTPPPKTQKQTRPTSLRSDDARASAPKRSMPAPVTSQLPRSASAAGVPREREILPRPIATGSSISDRQTQSHIDDLADVMRQQLSIVQPENPHIANIVILGTPNAGKSTLVNHLVGQKISAVSHKRNTTRSSVLGVACKDNKQLVIFDTPGVLPKLLSNKYQKELSLAAFDSAQGCDVTVIIIDVVKQFSPAEYELLQKAKDLATENPEMKLFLVLNKMDLCKPLAKAKTVLQMIQNTLPVPATNVFHTSFYPGKEKGIDYLTNALYSASHSGEWEYPSTMRTDQSLVELVNEIVREKIFHRVHQEIPYRVRIRNTGWTHVDERTLRIDLTLEVDTKQQKLILTGHQDSMLRYIVQRALPEVEALVGKKVYLFLKCIVPHTL